MFRVNEALNGRGTLSVKDGKMVLHVTLLGKNILNLYAGKAENAVKDEANWIAYSVDSVTYKDGSKDMVNGFDIPVPVYGSDFDLALVGKKGTWYDHKVSISEIE